MWAEETSPKLLYVHSMVWFPKNFVITWRWVNEELYTVLYSDFITRAESSSNESKSAVISVKPEETHHTLVLLHIRAQAELSVFSRLRLTYSMRSRGYLRRFTLMLTDVLQRLSPNTTQNIKRADEKQWWSNAHKPTEQRDLPAVYLTVLQSNLTFRGIPSILRTNRCLVKCSRCSFLYKKH